MNKEFMKMYPTGAAAGDTTDPAGNSDVAKVVTYAGTAGTLDASTYDNNKIAILLTTTSAMTYAIRNPNPGTIYVIEANGTGVNNRVVTFTGCTLNALGNNTATLDAQGECMAVLCISATKYLLLNNIGAIVLSTV